jgi:hypothetical protein
MESFHALTIFTQPGYVRYDAVVCQYVYSVVVSNLLEVLTKSVNAVPLMGGPF